MSLSRQILLVCLIALLAGGGYFGYGAFAAKEETANSGQRRGGGAIKVEVATAELREFATTLEAVGSTRASQSIAIQPNAEGTVTEVLFTSGQKVAKADALLRMDQALQQAELEEAKAALVQVDLELERAETLRTSQVVAKSTLETIKARRAAAQAAVIRAEKNLSDRTLIASFSGVTGLSNVDVGARITENTIVTTLDDLEIVELEFAVSEQYFGVIKKGMAITAYSAAFRDVSFSGQVSEVGSRIDAVSRSFSVRASLPNKDNALPAGMFMRIVIALETGEAPSVPEEAVVAEGGGAYVFAVEEGKAVRKVVTLGRRVPGFVEIVEGLEAGATVVVRGTNKVRSNAPVDIINGEAPAKTSETKIPDARNAS